MVREPTGGIHDRWVISEHQTYNLSGNTVASRQYAEITKSPSRPPFSELWEGRLDILEEWNKIQKFLS